MRSRVRTGNVIQIRNHGPNYIVLGKVQRPQEDGTTRDYICATRNGNITSDGKLKRGDADQKPKIHAFASHQVKRVHATRTVDVESVTTRNRTLRRVLSPTNGRNGVAVDAPNIVVQLSELTAAL